MKSITHRIPSSTFEKISFNNATENEVDSIACFLHNTGSTLAGNTPGEDVEWFARWIYQRSGNSQISNDEFRTLKLLPDRSWTERRWDTLSPKQANAWRKLAALCLSALPSIADRIGHRFMEQSKALTLLDKQRRKENYD